MKLLGFRLPTKNNETRALSFANSFGTDVLTPTAVGNGFLSLPVVFGCVRLIASRISSLPVRVLDGSEKVVDSPQWLVKPNDLMPTRELITGLVWSLLLDGSAFILPNYDDTGRVVGLTLPNPRQVTLRANSDDEIVFNVLGQPYSNPIIHAKYLAIPGELRGTAPVEAARVAIASGEASQEFIKDQFTNSATMNYALVAKEPMAIEDKMSLAAQVKALHHGAKNSYLPLVLDSEISIKSLSITAEQAQFLQLSTWTSAAIAGQIFGVDPTLMGISQPGSTLTYSNAIDRERNLWTDTLQPIVHTIEAALSYLLPADQRVDLNEQPLLLGSPRDRASIANTMANINTANQNELEETFSQTEIRAVLGYQPLS